MQKTILLLSISFWLSLSLQAQTNKLIYVKGGRLYHPDGKEVAMWGVNLQPCLSWEYNARMKKAGIPKDAATWKKMTDESLAELELLGCKVIRCHLTPADFTDEKGNLVETIYLDLLDYMITETHKRGMYSYISFINHMGSGEVPNSFMHSKKDKFDFRAEWMLNEEVIGSSKNYITQLLNRKNPYSELEYKSDTSIALWEIINEPRYYKYEEFKKTPYSHAYTAWLKKRNLKDNQESYLIYRKQSVLKYINGIYETIRATGDEHPITWNCNWNRMILGHEDVFEAIAESKVEVVSFCNYPGQNVVKSPYQENPEDLSRYDFTEWYQKFYGDKDYYGWVLRDDFKNKAKVVYEFETFYNQSAYLYPAMADFMRAMGVQMAAMWHYSMPAYAQEVMGSHVLNLKCTPKKAAAFAVAAKIFENTPILQPYHVASPLEHQSDKFTYSYANNMSLYSDNEFYYYSNGVEDKITLKPSKNVKEVFGYGTSSLISYEGTGNYYFTISEKEIELHIQPDVIHHTEQWRRTKEKDDVVTGLVYDKERKIQLYLDGWENGKYTVYEVLDGKQTKKGVVSELNLNLSPGHYRIAKE
jgi:hypothetical protein